MRTNMVRVAVLRFLAVLFLAGLGPASISRGGERTERSTRTRAGKVGTTARAASRPGRSGKTSASAPARATPAAGRRASWEG